MAIGFKAFRVVLGLDVLGFRSFKKLQWTCVPHELL